MDAQDFSPERRRLLVPLPDGNWAFVPPGLPTSLDLSADVLLALGRADRAVGRLNGVGSWMPNPYLLIQPFIRREAVLSSKIEGTQASLSDLALYEASPVPVAGLPRDVQEVANYVRALEDALGPGQPLPVSLRLIQQLHATLLEGVRGHETRPGEFRTIQNYIGHPGSPIEEASYVPPPPTQMLEALRALELYLHADSKLPPLVRLALTHYQFEAIHPFRDGNGRVGRLLIAVLLVEERLIGQPLLYLSAYFERERASYYHLLAGVSQRGEWDAWLRFFLNGVEEQSLDAVVRAGRLLALRDEYRQRLESARASALPLRLVDGLFDSPVLTIMAAQRELGVTHRAASLNMDKLVQAGVVRPVPGRVRNQLFIAGEILDLLERDLPPTAEKEPEQQAFDLA